MGNNPLKLGKNINNNPNLSHTSVISIKRIQILNSLAWAVLAAGLTSFKSQARIPQGQQRINASMNTLIQADKRFSFLSDS